MRRRWLAVLAMILVLLQTIAPVSGQGTSTTGGSFSTGGNSTGSFNLGGSGGLGSSINVGGSGALGGSGGLGTQGGGTGNGIGSSTFTSSTLLGQSMNQNTTNANSVGGTSLLGKSYAYPLAKGLPTQNILANTTQGGGGTTITFGQPLFTVSGTGTTGAGGTGAGGTRLGGTQQQTGFGQTGTATTQTGQGSFASSAGVDRVVPYITELGFQPNLTPPTVVGQQVQNMLASTPRYAGSGVQVVTQPQGGIVLTGQAATARDRQVMEAMARLTPGVRNVRNEIVVPGGR